MEIVYSISAKLGVGIGLTSLHAIDQIKKAGYLKQTITGDTIQASSNDAVIKDNLFDVFASMRISPPVSILHGWGHMMYAQILKAHSLGAKTVLERASSHITWQNQILVEEFKRFGFNSKPIHPWSIKKQLAEYKETDYVTVPSQFAYDSFLGEKYPEEKLLLNPYGVDVKKFKQMKIESDGKFRALFIGANWIRKNLYDAEKAWADLNLKDAEFIVRSDAPKFPDINYDSIVVVKWFDDVVETYNKADVIIFPTLEEGNALTVGEAAACCTPSITTSSSGTWLDEKSCLFVPIHDIDALKEKIQYAYDNRDVLKKMGKEARKISEKNTWESYGKRLIANYRKIAE